MVHLSKGHHKEFQLVLPVKVPPGMPPEVMPPGMVVEAVDVVFSKVLETKATMKAPKAAEHLGLCLMVYYSRT